MSVFIKYAAPLLIALATGVVVGAATCLAQAYGVVSEYFSLNRSPGGTFGKLEADTGLLARLADSQEVALDRVEAEWGSEGVSLAFWAPSVIVVGLTAA